MDSITDEEKKVVEQLRRRTINDMTPKMREDSSVFYRFAKARDFNLAEAETMLRKHIAWRKETGIDTILIDYKLPKVFLKYAPVTFLCFDKTGCGVRNHDFGRTDIKGLLNVFKTEEILKHTAYVVEKDKDFITTRNEKGKKRYQLGKPIYSPIYDFEGFTYAKAVNIKILQIMTSMLLMFLDNYPEFLSTVMIINTPIYFQWIYAVLKSFLPEAVIQKVRIFGSDGYQEALLEYIDADDLPAYLGGNRTDPDGNPRCETFIPRGEPIPKSYYRQKRTKRLTLEFDVEKLILMPFSKEEVTFEVKEENSYLEWEFETKNRDIDFSLLFTVQTTKETVELIPKQRIDTCDEPEKGRLKCENVGNYTIVFDNSHSWFHSKEIYYRAQVKSPKTGELINAG